MKIKALVAAVALVAGASAQADIQDGVSNSVTPHVGGSEMALIVRDSRSEQLYMRDLGITTSALRDNQVDSTVFTADSSLSSFLAGGSEYSWTVVGWDSNAQWAQSEFGSTFQTFEEIANFITRYEGAYVTSTGTADPDATILQFGRDLDLLYDSLNSTYPGVENPAGLLGSVVQIPISLDFLFSLGATMDLTYYSSTVDPITFAPGSEVVSNAIGTFSLAANGDLEFVPVPLPAAVWLLASGLLGLIGVARRRKA